ncbi:MAG TPA: radical SAM protein [Coriobacteriia bacterium]|nr:radical SAM protein [Coriobacteriia bacterium]
MGTLRRSRIPLWLRPPVVLGFRLLHDMRGGSSPKTGSSRGYYCRALTGESNYNICINCDLTVSCNCQDFSGRGKIGDLRAQGLTEVFEGPVVRRFLAQLAELRFPTDVCAICPELRALPREAVEPRGAPPRRGVIVENTAACNLACGLCRREELLAHRDQRFMSLEHVTRVAELVRTAGVETLYFFNLGEPFLPADVLEQVTRIRAANPAIRLVTSTNGLLLDAPEKSAAALLMDYIYVSLDGVDQRTVEAYQVGGDFDRAYRNMARLVGLRDERARFHDGIALPIIEWKYVTFRHNDRPAHVRRAVALAREAGVDVLGFYRGAAPMPKRSLRFGRDPVFSEIGVRLGDGVIVNFAGVPEHLLGP